MQNSMDVYLGVNLCEFQLLSLQNCLPVRVWVTYKYESHQCPSCSHATIKKGDRIYRLFTSIFFLMFYSWLSHLVPHLSSFFSYLYRFIPLYIIILQSSPMSGRKISENNDHSAAQPRGADLRTGLPGAKREMATLWDCQK